MKLRTLGSALFVFPALALAACGEDSHVLATGDGTGGTGTQGTGGAAGNAGAPASGAGGMALPGAGGGPTCSAAAATESKCSDGADDDCDGYADCLDSDCEGKSCGSGSGLTCTGGACLQPSATGLPELPRIDNVRVIQRGDTAIVEFEPVAGALDYRVYPLPDPKDVLVGQNGELAVKNAVYRCSGDRPFRKRADDPATAFDASLAGGANLLHDFERKEADSILGYVFLTPGAGRKPVYRLSDPNAGGGFQNADWVAPLYGECNAADYVVGTEERDRLVAAGFRDDGIQFYVADSGTKPVYRKLYEKLWNGTPSLFFTTGAEFDARAKDKPEEVQDFGERFKVLATEETGSVALHRVLYNGNTTFDVLAAGDARFKRVLEQGNQPVWSVTWPGLKANTTLVVEALDQGCPFPGGYVAAHHAAADDFNYPSLTLDEARISGSGEVFINGQHEEANRPKPVARAFVDVTPAAKPDFEWYETFDEGAAWEPFQITAGNNGMHVMRNSKWAADFSGCTDNLTIGPLLGQLVVGYADGGSSCNFSMTPLGRDTTLEAGDFLHVRMSTDVPSTGRRYPQIMITTTPIIGTEGVVLDTVPLHSRLGPMPFDMGAPPGSERSIIVQPFGGYHEFQIQFCDQRGWGVSAQCPQANVYGDHAGNYSETWSEPWRPVPLLGDIAGFDRPVQFDVYASTERVYVFMDDKPAGCAVLPAGKMPAGPVNVAFRGVLYHSGIDESVTPDDSGHQYLKRFSLSHFDRHMDDFGISRKVAAPPWNEATMPCASRWYGGG